MTLDVEISGLPSSDTICYVSMFDFIQNDFIVLDSVGLDDEGVFHFERKGFDNRLVRIFFSSQKDRRKGIDIFTEREDVRLIGDYDRLDRAEVLGSDAQSDAQKFNHIKQSYQSRFDRLGMLYEKFVHLSEKRRQDSVQRLYNDLTDRYHDSILFFASEHHTTVFSPFVVYVNLYDLDKDRVVDIYKSYPSEVRKSYFGTRLYNSILSVKENRVGNTFKDFSAMAVDDQLFRLKECHSEFLIVHFWSSYCEPCLENVVVLKKLYREFSDKLQIVSITLDDKAGYLENCSYYDLPWVHIVQKKGWESPLFKSYGIRYLPTGYFLDDKRKIIANRIDFDDVREVLSVKNPNVTDLGI